MKITCVRHYLKPLFYKDGILIKTNEEDGFPSLLKSFGIEVECLVMDTHGFYEELKPNDGHGLYIFPNSLIDLKSRWNAYQIKNKEQRLAEARETVQRLETELAETPNVVADPRVTALEVTKEYRGLQLEPGFDDVKKVLRGPLRDGRPVPRRPL